MKALITGASSGMGRDMAKILSQKGYDLILVARDEKKLEEVKKQLKTETKIVVMDISKEENCKKIYEENKDIDILINNAGFGDCGHFEETSLDKDIQMIHTNIIAYHILTKLYLKEMIKKDSGKILNVASIAGFMPGPLMTTYYSTKNYVVRFSESIREELRRKKSKVQISILCPGPVDTNFNKVADVEFALKGLSSEYVAKYAINKFFKGKFYIVPGWKIKLARIGAKLAPASFVAKISYNMQKRKIR
ncbi:MAG: SDR family NAD(P)-dependent oxidoreductase [Clostridia bacterium]|jgi:oxidoreductase, short chain dehydrogenase/reductase family|nr:SDR family oxidoreductase [Clostridia bacterium]